MARIAGVDLPQNKQVWIGLTYIYGIGRSRSSDILGKAEVPAITKVKDLTEDEARRIRKVITDEGKVEGDLRKEISQNIKRLMEIGCYRGMRHRRGLPVRGQRTHTNARTRKGPRKRRRRGQEEGDQEVSPRIRGRRWPKRKQQEGSARAPSSKEKSNVPHGVAHIQATFNNTIVSIADPEGNVLAWSSAGRIGFKGSRKGTPFAAQVAAQNCRQAARKEHGVRSVDVMVKGPGAGPRVGDPRPPGRGPRHQVDQGRDADPAQRLPAAQAAPRLAVVEQLFAVSGPPSFEPPGVPGAVSASSQVEVPVASGRGRQVKERSQWLDIHGPVCRLCRREGMKLFLKGDRCFKDKCAIERRNYPPGQHGTPARPRTSATACSFARSRRSSASTACSKRSSALFRSEADRRKGITGENLLVSSSGASTTSSTASASRPRAPRRASSSATATSQVNGRKITIPSYQVQGGADGRGQGEEPQEPLIRSSVETARGRGVPEWLELDAGERSAARCSRLPKREDIKLPIQEQLIVELYSR